jgi:hypothetical protein
VKYASVPVLKDLRISAGSQSATITGTFQASALLDGIVNCLVQSTRQPDPISVSQVQLNSNAGAKFKTSSVEFSAEITGLTAVTWYNVYCAFISEYAGASDLTQVLATRTAFKSGCCGTVGFPGVPLYVVESGSSTAPYTFSFTISLSGLPDTAFTVHPKLTTAKGLNIETHNYGMILPVSATFSSVSNGLSSVFYVKILDSSLGQLQLTADLSGPSSADYVVDTNISIALLPNTAALPAPSFASANFMSSGSSLLLIFSGPTDLAGMNSVDGSWTCSKLFIFSNASLCSCQWTNSSTVSLSFPSTFIMMAYDAFLVPGASTVTLKAGMVRAACSPGTNCSTNLLSSAVTVVVGIAGTAVSPIVILQGAATVVDCRDYVLDASSSYGNGGRAWKSFGWTVTDNGSSSATLLTDIAVGLNKGDVYGPLFIPRSYLYPTELTFTLTLTNFLGAVSSASISVTVSPYEDGMQVPVQLSILGSTQIRVAVSAQTVIAANISFSDCGEFGVMGYEWKMIDLVDQSTVYTGSSSPNPLQLTLPPYSFQSQHMYSVTITAFSSSTKSSSASALVAVTSGVVQAVITGGYERTVPVDLDLVLDGSQSRDFNVPSRLQDLSYSWRCHIVSPSAEYGSDCGYLISSGSTSSMAYVTANTMSLDQTYQFSLVISSPDGRYDSVSLTVVGVASDSSTVTMNTQYSSPYKYFMSLNGSKLSLFGSVGGNVAVVASWSATFSGQRIALTGLLTEPRRTFSAAEADGISFPLSIAPYALVSNRQYTFTLSSCLVASSSQCSYASLDVFIAGSPSNGYVTVSPATGTALSTSFQVSSNGWVDAAEAFPLLYSFLYQGTSSGPFLQIRSPFYSPYTFTQLPQGSQKNAYTITLIGIVTSSFGAAANATTAVTVAAAMSPSYSNYSKVLTLARTSFGQTQQSDAIMSVVNNVASVLTSVDCSGAPNCSRFHRDECESVVHTCGSCLAGYSGVVGPWNGQCWSADAGVHGVGGRCSENSDCLHGYCDIVRATCQYPAKQCASNSSDVCSGHGQCSYMDGSGTEMSGLCLINNPLCTAHCACYDGYGGRDCSKTPEEIVELESLRTTLCLALNETMTKQSCSPALTDSLVSSLLLSYSVSNTYNETSHSVCGTVLTYISGMADNGYFSGVRTSTLQDLTTFLSTFVVVPPPQETTNDVFLSAVNSVLVSIMDTSVDGELDTKYVSDNVRFRTESVLLSDLRLNRTLSAPLLSEEIAYGVVAPAIVLSSGGLDACRSAFSSPYAKLAVAQLNLNPYSDVESSISSVLRVSTLSSKSEQPADSAAIPTPNSSFLLTFPFLFVQDFAQNNSFPECNEAIGSSSSVEQGYCSGCSLETYTNVNVTFRCADVTVLCPSGSEAIEHSGLRRLTNVIREVADSARSYSTCSVAAGTNLVRTVTVNPFEYVSKPALIFISAILFIFVTGVVILIRIDAHEHNVAVYVEAELREKAATEANKKKNMWARKSSAGTTADIGTVLAAAFGIVHSPRKLSKVGILPAKHRRLDRETKMFVDISCDFNDDEEDFFDKHPPEQTPKTSKSSQFSDDSSESDSGLFPIKNLLASALPSYLEPTDGYSPGQPSQPFVDKLSLSRYMQLIVMFHDYTLFLAPTTGISRLLRWLAMCRGVLVNLFITTMFYVIMYTNNGECYAFTDEVSCLAKPSLIQYNTRLCAWNAWNATVSNNEVVIGQQCAPTSPANGTVFLIMMSCLMLMFTVPIDVFLGAVIDEYARYRPDLSKLQNTMLGTCFNWRNNDWLGSDAKSIAPATLQSDLYIRDDNETDIDTDNDAEIEAGMDTPCDLRGLPEYEHMSPADRPKGARKLAKTIKNILRRYNPQEWESRRWKKSLEVHCPSEFMLRHYTYDQLAARIHLDKDDDHVVSKYRSQVLYDSLQPAEEEVQFMLARIKKYFVGEMEYMSRKKDLVAVDERRDARVAAIMQQLRVHPNGELMPLSIVQTLRYGSSLDRLRSITDTRKANTELILGQLNEMKAQGLEDCMDATLLQHFILEQMPLHKQFALQNIFFSYQRLSAPSISIWRWVAVWSFTYFVFAGLFYWLFVWAVHHGDRTLYEWGANFALSLFQDILVLKVAKVLIQYVFVFESSRPQFKQIYRVFTHLATYLGSGDEVGKREARQVKLQTTFSVVQYVSASCRVASSHVADNLMAASLLKLVDDIDVANCRADRNHHMNWLQYTASSFFGAIYLIHDYSANQVYDLLMPMLFASFLIANKELFDYGPVYVAIPYIVVVGLLAYLYLFLRPARERLKQIRCKRMLMTHHAVKVNSLSGDYSNRVAVLLLSKRFRVHKHKSSWDWLKSHLQRSLDALLMRIVTLSNPFFRSWSESNSRKPKHNWLTFQGWYEWCHTTAAGVSPYQRELLWRNMNVPPPSQDVQASSESGETANRTQLLRYLSTSADVRSSDLLSQQTKLAETFSRLTINIPQEIRTMLAGEGVNASGTRSISGKEEVKLDWASVLDELSPYELAERIDRCRTASLSSRSLDTDGVSPRVVSCRSASFDYDSPRNGGDRRVSFSLKPPSPTSLKSDRNSAGLSHRKATSFSFRLPKRSAKVAIDPEINSIPASLATVADSATRGKLPAKPLEEPMLSPSRVYVCNDPRLMDFALDDELPSSYSHSVVVARERHLYSSRLHHDEHIQREENPCIVIKFREEAPIFCREELVSKILHPHKQGPQSTPSKHEHIMSALTSSYSRFSMGKAPAKKLCSPAYEVRDFKMQVCAHWAAQISAVVRRYGDQETIPCHILLERTEAALGRYYWHHNTVRVKMTDESKDELLADLDLFVNQKQFPSWTQKTESAARIRARDEHILLSFQQRCAHLSLFNNSVIVAILWRIREEHGYFSMELICEAILLQIDENKNKYGLNEAMFIDEDSLWTYCNDKLVSGYRDKWVGLDAIHLAVDGAIPICANVMYMVDFVEWLFIKLELLDGLMQFTD